MADRGNQGHDRDSVRAPSTGVSQIDRTLVILFISLLGCTLFQTGTILKSYYRRSLHD